ncbi:adenylate/guanylate cyclase domain-containing protein [Phyllobacterium zundukense]|uniref:Guanylate cyclase domain-containing protein n=1 Tax=Phyllobacterium zundukense TaxID=1867719 RepID=A0A2N9W000_9HYPH|nr:adenylate/guanylate cyclase domain-containing protein [Phyllobacterium zundukense]ATU94457.1 hypothetical protein BLM14_22275 [Phyllobacterium zundukense]PIO45068.1 hypothetical protein B5P45_09715 [Phyllobacterium zundukense]
MVTIPEIRDELLEEVATILSNSFTIDVTNTNSVPHSGDPSITFPNLDAQTQGCKLIETCVLYIDIRRSTELNLTHKAKTVAKLYSSFVRAMTKCARHYGGHVRGIIGDRVMVIFDKENAYANAVDTAILMNSTARYVINKHFKSDEVKCGIGIDAGRMLATKTGFRRKGVEQNNYRNLVWLGRAANVASKLTDLANKSGEVFNYAIVSAAYDYGSGWTWQEEDHTDFLLNLEVQHSGGRPWISHRNQYWKSFIRTTKPVTIRATTPEILMTNDVYEGFKASRPDSLSIKNGWFKKINVKVPGYEGEVYGGDVFYTAFQEA